MSFPGLGVNKRTKNISRLDEYVSKLSPFGMGARDIAPVGDVSHFSIEAELWKDINGTPTSLGTCKVKHSDITPIAPTYFTFADATEADNGSSASALNWNLDLSGNGDDYYAVTIEVKGEGEIFFLTGDGSQGPATVKGAGYAKYTIGLQSGV